MSSNRSNASNIKSSSFHSQTNDLSTETTLKEVKDTLISVRASLNNIAMGTAALETNDTVTHDNLDTINTSISSKHLDKTTDSVNIDGQSVNANITNSALAVVGDFYPPTQVVSGSITVDNFPSTQVVSGSVNVGNFPASQNISGSVSVNNFPSTQVVSGSVNVGNFPATQPISGSVNVGNFPASQNISGSVGVNNFPATQTVSGSVNVGNFPATQTVAGSVNVGNFPSMQAVTGTDGTSQKQLKTDSTGKLDITASTAINTVINSFASGAKLDCNMYASKDGTSANMELLKTDTHHHLLTVLTNDDDTIKTSFDTGDFGMNCHISNNYLPVNILDSSGNSFAAVSSSVPQLKATLYDTNQNPTSSTMDGVNSYSLNTHITNLPTNPVPIMVDGNIGITLHDAIGTGVTSSTAIYGGNLRNGLHTVVINDATNPVNISGTVDASGTIFSKTLDGDGQQIGSVSGALSVNDASANAKLTSMNTTATATNSKVDSVNTSIGTTNSKIDATNTLITASNSLLSSVNTAIGTTNTKMETNNTLTTSTNTKLDTTNTYLQIIGIDTNTSKDYLSTIATKSAIIADATTSLAFKTQTQKIARNNLTNDGLMVYNITPKKKYINLICFSNNSNQNSLVACPNSILSGEIIVGKKTGARNFYAYLGTSGTTGYRLVYEYIDTNGDEQSGFQTLSTAGTYYLLAGSIVCINKAYIDDGGVNPYPGLNSTTNINILMDTANGNFQIAFLSSLRTYQSIAVCPNGAIGYITNLSYTASSADSLNLIKCGNYGTRSSLFRWDTITSLNIGNSGDRDGFGGIIKEGEGIFFVGEGASVTQRKLSATLCFEYY